MEEDQSGKTLVLADCAKFHRGKWDTVLLEVHCQNADLMVEAAAVVEQLPAEMVAVGRELLKGMQEPILTLSLALCATKRGTGGRVPGPDLQDDPNIDPLTAKRIMDKRRTAALSKFRQKAASLAMVAIGAGLIPAPAEGFNDEDPLGLEFSNTAVHPGAAAASWSDMDFPSEPCSPDATQRSAAAAGSGDRGLLRRGRSFTKSAPMTTAAAAAELTRRSSGFALPENSMDVCVGDQTRKRPQRAVQRQQQQQPARQHLRSSVKRHKSQQLLGSSASQQVSNRGLAATRTGGRSARSVSPVLETYTEADWERWDAEQQDIMLQGMAGRGTDGYGAAGLFAFTGAGFDAAAGQDAAWQQSQQQQAAASSNAGFADVYSQLPPAGLEGTAQQQQGGQNGAAAGAAGYTPMGAADSMMMDPMQQQEAGEADGAWLMREFGVPTSPTLADLLSMETPAESPEAVNGRVGAQMPNNAGHSSQNSRGLSQHSGAMPAAGGQDAGSAAGAPLRQQAAAVLGSTGGMQGPAQGALMHAGATGRAQMQTAGGMGDVRMACMPVPPAQAPLAERLASMMSAGVSQEQQLHGSSCRTDGMHSAQQQVPVAGFGASPNACGYASGNSSGSMLSADGNTGVPGGQMQQMQDRLADRLLQGQYMQGPNTQNYTGALQGTGFQQQQQQQQQAAPWEAPAAGHGNPTLLPQGSAQAGMGQGYLGMGAAQAAYGNTGNVDAAAPAMHSPDTGSAFSTGSDSRGGDGLQSMLMSALSHGGQHALLSPNGGLMHRRATAEELERALLINRLQQQQLLQEIEAQSSGATQDQRADTGGRVSPAFSEGCMGPSCAPTYRGHSLSAGGAQGMGGPAGYGMQACNSAQATGHNGNSMAAFSGAFRNERGMHSTAAGPAGAARPAMRASPFQRVQQPAGPAAPYVQHSISLLEQQEPVAATAQGLISFVTEVLRSSNRHVIAAVNSMVPVLATAQQGGYDIGPVLRRVKGTLLEAHLQAQRAQLLGVLEDAPAAAQQQTALAAEELAAALKSLVRLDMPAQLQSASSATYFPGAADGAAAGAANNSGFNNAPVGAAYGQPGMNAGFGGNGGFGASNSGQSGYQMAGMMAMQHQRGTATVHMQDNGAAAVAGSLEWLDGMGMRGRY